MKGHKEHHHRETGGANEAEEDLDTKPEARTNAKKIDDEAEERKHGGEAKKRVKRKHGGEVHHSACKCEKCMGGEAKKRAHGGKAEHEKKHVEVHGEHERHRADRKERKSGGRASGGSNEHPYSSARAGEVPHGRRVMSEME